MGDVCTVRRRIRAWWRIAAAERGTGTRWIESPARRARAGIRKGNARVRPAAALLLHADLVRGAGLAAARESACIHRTRMQRRATVQRERGERDERRIVSLAGVRVLRPDELPGGVVEVSVAVVETRGDQSVVGAAMSDTCARCREATRGEPRQRRGPVGSTRRIGVLRARWWSRERTGARVRCSPVVRRTARRGTALSRKRDRMLTGSARRHERARRRAAGLARVARGVAERGRPRHRPGTRGALSGEALAGHASRSESTSRSSSAPRSVPGAASPRSTILPRVHATTGFAPVAARRADVRGGGVASVPVHRLRHRADRCRSGIRGAHGSITASAPDIPMAPGARRGAAASEEGHAGRGEDPPRSLRASHATTQEYHAPNSGDSARGIPLVLDGFDPRCSAGSSPSAPSPWPVVLRPCSTPHGIERLLISRAR